MACSCCNKGFHCMTRITASTGHAKLSALTVELLSGALLAKLTVEQKISVADLKMKIEAAAELPPGCLVRWLAWGGRELKDEELLQDLGISSTESLVAICADAIVGDFEFYLPGCPTCDYNADIQRLSFFSDGTAMIDGEKYRYTLGGNVKSGTCLMRQLEFVQDTDAPAEVHSGMLWLSVSNPINRRVKIPDLNIDVEDVRWLEQKGRSYLQLKMEIMFAYSGQCFPFLSRGGEVLDRTRAVGWLYNNSPYEDVSLDEDAVDRAYYRAWTQHEKRQEEEKAESLDDFYDTLVKQSSKSRKKQLLWNADHGQTLRSRGRKNKVQRWERPQWM